MALKFLLVKMFTIDFVFQCCIDENSPTHLALKVNKQLKSFGAKHMGRPEKLLTR